MSAPSIAPYHPFRRVRVVSHRVQADPAAAVIELAPDRRFSPRCGRCGSPPHVAARRTSVRCRRRRAHRPDGVSMTPVTVSLL